MNTLQNKIKNKTAKVAIIGQGYVGLPLALTINRAGFFVWGIDKDQSKILNLKSKISYIDDISNDEVACAIKSKKFQPTNSFNILKQADVIIIAVPTPLDEYKIPDLACIKDATCEIAKYLRPNQLIILESTTYPGTTEEIVLPMLLKCQMSNVKCQNQISSKFQVSSFKIFLAFSPERVDPGNKNFNTKNTPKIIGGINSESTKIATLFYSQVIDKPVPVSSARAAEMTKLLENIFRIVNISMINELALLANKMNIDIWEVIEAASTKPYGFMPFYPGPGIGGHCLQKNHIVFIKNQNNYTALPLYKIYNKFNKKQDTLEVLSYNLATKKAEFNPIRFFTKRLADDLIEIKTHYKHKLIVTSKHPVIVREKNTFQQKYAKDIKKDDKLVFCVKLPEISANQLSLDLIDIFTQYAPQYAHKIRIKPQKTTIKTIKELIKPYIKKQSSYWDYMRYNYIPLSLYNKIKTKIAWNHKYLLLSTGRGPSYHQLQAVLPIDKDFCRFLGYYLSEGCITEENKTKRIRLTFHTNEKEYITDVKNILQKKNIPFSTYQDKKWQSFHIKISSYILAIALKKFLKCGTNCYTMQIPWELFYSNQTFRKELLAGLLRGDGGVSVINKKHTYYHKGKEKYYTHARNSATVCFFSSSPILFQQAQLLLNEQFIINDLDKRAGLLRIKTVPSIKQITPFFLGEKLQKLNTYFDKQAKIINYGYSDIKNNFITLKVKETKKLRKTTDVYSMEVEPNKTIITDGGLVVHNCIAVDPFYLSYKAKEYGFFTRFIDLAGEINELMPHYVITTVATALNYSQAKSIKNAKILIMGISYKKDIKDTRESAAYKIAEILQQKGARLSFFDPYIDNFQFSIFNFQSNSKSQIQIPKIQKITASVIQSFDLVLIITDHSNIDYNQIAQWAKVVVDTRNAIKMRGFKNVYRL